ncbi:MAG: hypothetical protein A2W81_02545 [Betaproteobacteria bacterium RIFCSPLOWO2_12_61_14]|nr:MAG: hypothetical protein A2W81_02545 [Betaproteobacteria bacterium RIFCSPLOWO2_12_61_14]
MTAAAGAPIYALVFGLPREWVLASGIILMLLIWRHKKNIQNLLAGKEPRIGKRGATASDKTAPGDNRSA